MPSQRFALLGACQLYARGEGVAVGFHVRLELEVPASSVNVSGAHQRPLLLVGGDFCVDHGTPVKQLGNFLVQHAK